MTLYTAQWKKTIKANPNFKLDDLDDLYARIDFATDCALATLNTPFKGIDRANSELVLMGAKPLTEYEKAQSYLNFCGLSGKITKDRDFWNDYEASGVEHGVTSVDPFDSGDRLRFGVFMMTNFYPLNPNSGLWIADNILVSRGAPAYAPEEVEAIHMLLEKLAERVRAEKN